MIVGHSKKYHPVPDVVFAPSTPTGSTGYWYRPLTARRWQQSRLTRRWQVEERRPVGVGGESPLINTHQKGHPPKQAGRVAPTTTQPPYAGVNSYQEPPNNNSNFRTRPRPANTETDTTEVVQSRTGKPATTIDSRQPTIQQSQPTTTAVHYPTERSLWTSCGCITLCGTRSTGASWGAQTVLSIYHRSTRTTLINKVIKIK